MVSVVRSSAFDRWLRNWKTDAQDRSGSGEDRSSCAGTQVTSSRSAAASRRLRIDYGPGYRVYYLQESETLILLLCGGDKSSQDGDIKTAQRIAKEWKNNEQD